MAEIKLFRIDSRLIHGQIITKWLKVTQADKIVVVDETLAADDFMKEIYVAAVPKGISVDIYDTDGAMEEWERSCGGICQLKYPIPLNGFKVSHFVTA